MMEEIMPLFGLIECRERRRDPRQRTGGCWNCRYKDKRERDQCIAQLQDDLINMIREINADRDPLWCVHQELYAEDRIVGDLYYCRECGIGIEKNAERCGNCGRRIRWN